jgi:hypothetical protein
MWYHQPRRNDGSNIDWRVVNSFGARVEHGLPELPHPPRDFLTLLDVAHPAADDRDDRLADELRRHDRQRPCLSS